MTGGAGLAMGISQGLDKAADGMVRRQQVQMQSAMFNQQMQFNQMSMGMKMQQHQSQQEKTALDIEALQLKIGDYENQLARRDAFDAMRAFEYTGDASLLNSASNNPKVKNLLASKGIAKFHNLDYMGKDKLAEFGITDEMRKDPSKRLVLVTTVNGDTKVMDAMSMYATTGFLNEVGEIKQKEIENHYKVQQQKMNLSLTGHQINNAQLTTSINQNKLTESNLELEDMVNWLENNPDKTITDYKNLGKGSTFAPSNYEKDLALLSRRYNTGEISKEEYESGVNNLDNKYQGVTPTAKQKENKEKLTNLEDFKEKTGAKENWDIDINKLDSADKTKLQIMAKEERKDIPKDFADSLPVLTTAANKLNVKDLSKTTGIVDASVMQLMDKTGIDLDSDVYKQSSNYNIIKNAMLKSAYGSQISQADRDSITDQLGSIYRSDVGVRTKLVENIDTLIAKYDSYKTTHPAYYAVNMKGAVDTLTQVRNTFEEVDTSIPTAIPLNDKGEVLKSKLVTGKTYKGPNGEQAVWTGTSFAKAPAKDK
jgi:hypothetical protein